MKLNKFVCLFVCVFVTGQKNIFYEFLLSRLLVEKNMVLVRIKSQETFFPSGFKGQKNIFYDFLVSRPLVKKHAPGWNQK